MQCWLWCRDTIYTFLLAATSLDDGTVGVFRAAQGLEAQLQPALQEALAAAVDGRSSVEGNPWGPKARPPSWGLQEHIGEPDPEPDPDPDPAQACCTALILPKKASQVLQHLASV